MTKKSKTLLILSCVFVTIAVLLSFIHIMLSYGTYSIMFEKPENLGEALGEVFALIFFIAYSVIFAAGILIASGLTLAFDIPLLKINGKKWYSITILIVAIAAIVLAAFAIAMIPVVSRISTQMRNSSSSSSSSDSTAAMIQAIALLY